MLPLSSRLSTLRVRFYCFSVHLSSFASVAGCEGALPLSSWSLIDRVGRGPAFTLIPITLYCMLLLHRLLLNKAWEVVVRR
jgi:hypothetical protein